MGPDEAFVFQPIRFGYDESSLFSYVYSGIKIGCIFELFL